MALKYKEVSGRVKTLSETALFILQVGEIIFG